MRQRGNILFLILLAVVLFAALSYAVTSSMRGGGKDSSDETARAQAADILSYFSQIDAAVLRMQLTGNMRPENISFRFTRILANGTNTSSYYHNTNCTTPECYVFNVDGGGVADRNFEKYSIERSGCCGSSKPGYFDMPVMKWPQAGTELNDLTMYINSVKGSVCDEINRQLGITAAPTTTGPFIAVSAVANWDNAAFTIDANASQLTGKNTFAEASGSSGDTRSCKVYHLLIAR